MAGSSLEQRLLSSLTQCSWFEAANTEPSAHQLQPDDDTRSGQVNLRGTWSELLRDFGERLLKDDLISVDHLCDSNRHVDVRSATIPVAHHQRDAP